MLTNKVVGGGNNQRWHMLVITIHRDEILGGIHTPTSCTVVFFTIIPK